MKIGQLAERAGIPAPTVRYYERRGLLAPPDRAPNGYRVYESDALERLQFIGRAKAAGLTLAEVRDVIDIWADGRKPCAHVANVLDAKLAELRQRRRELAAAERGLVELIDRGRSFDPADCRDRDICGLLSA